MSGSFGKKDFYTNKFKCESITKEFLPVMWSKDFVILRPDNVATMQNQWH